MTFADIVYAAACVVLPVGWGLGVVWLSNRIEARVARRTRHGARRRRVRPIEYHI